MIGRVRRPSRASQAIGKATATATAAAFNAASRIYGYCYWRLCIDSITASSAWRTIPSSIATRATVAIKVTINNKRNRGTGWPASRLNTTNYRDARTYHELIIARRCRRYSRRS